MCKNILTEQVTPCSGSQVLVTVAPYIQFSFNLHFMQVALSLLHSKLEGQLRTKSI